MRNKIVKFLQEELTLLLLTLSLLSKVKYFISPFREMILKENDIGDVQLCLIFTHSVDYPFLIYHQFPNC